MIGKVISGGQSGVDRAALQAARECGIPTGGNAPKGFKTEDGPDPSLGEVYGLKELARSDYQARTYANVLLSDATLLLTRFRGTLSGGTALAEREARRLGKPCLVVTLTASPVEPVVATQWLRLMPGIILNVAGSRESSNPGIGEQARAFLVRLFTMLGEDHVP